MWLNGEVLMCACPDCRAPMTVRVWLMLADCWQCGTSIELTEEQEREAQRLLAEAGIQQQRARQPAELVAAGATAPPAPAAPPAPPRSATRPISRPAPTESRPARPPAGRRRNQTRRLARTQSAMLHRFFAATPAWLISLVLHAVFLTLLALLTFDDPQEEEAITLSTSVTRADVEGGDEFKTDPKLEVQFDLPVPRNLDLADKKVLEVVVKADQDARELRLDPGVDELSLPSLNQVKAAIGGGHGLGGGRNLAARDPRLRVEIVNQEGGTTLTEAAVARGLRWLALHQNEDGHWSLHEFHRTSGCSCSGAGAINSDAAATSLALLPYLGAGQTHLVGRYKNYVSAGLRWLLAHQKPDGDLRANSVDNAGMYAHGQGAIVLCEAFLMTGDEELRVPAQRSIDFIVKAQHRDGGWRYTPGQAGDTSVVGWQLMALQSARAANLTVPTETMEMANTYLNSVQHANGSRYSYLPGHPPTHVMTAEALLCRMYLGWKLDSAALGEGIQYLSREHPPDERDPNIYYWYYATQAMHHFGGRPWTDWNERMREILVESQERRGHEAGSWSPRGDHSSAGGRVYMTALCVCSLEVYYRHLPIFRQLDLE